MNQWDDLTNIISMHDLYLEFAEVEVKRDDNERGRAHLYHKKKNDIPQCLTRNPRGATTFSFERMRFSNVWYLDSFEQAKLDKCANVEVLKVDLCFELRRLDIDGLEELRSLELLRCENLEHLQGLETRDKLKWMRWDPCHAKVVDYKSLTSLRVLQLTEVSHTTVIDLRNCHNLQELTIQDSDGLEDFPLFPNSKSMLKIFFRYCEKLRHRGPELLNLEGWRNVEFLDLEQCWSITNELESCPIMKNLKHLNVFGCYKLKGLPNLTKSKNLMTLKVLCCTELIKTYAYSSQFSDSMPMDLHPGLNTSNVSLHNQFVASRIVKKYCNKLKALLDLRMPKNLMTLKVFFCTELIETYASSSQFSDSMAMDIHPRLNTSGLSLHYQVVASRIFGKFGVSSQVCSLQLKE